MGKVRYKKNGERALKSGMRKRRRLRVARIWKHGLTEKQHVFVDFYTNPDSECYMNHKLSCKAAGFICKSDTGYIDRGRKLIKIRGVQMAIRDALGPVRDEIDEKIRDGIQKRLEDPMDSKWLSTADFYAKIMGDYSSEKKEVFSMSATERQQELAEIAKMIGLVESRKKQLESGENSTPARSGYAYVPLNDPEGSEGIGSDSIIEVSNDQDG